MAKAVAAPSGLSIARSDNKFTLTWKRGTKYAAQSLQYQVEGGGWTDISVSKTATEASIALTVSAYNPSKNKTASNIEFRVRGKKGKKWSAYASKSYSIAVPNTPYVGAESDSTPSNVGKYTWNFEVPEDGNKMFSRLDWESILVKECDETDGSKLSWTSSTLGWMTGTSTSNDGSKEITEDTDILANGSYTRWFRARTRGIGGDSRWNYTKRVYARSNQARTSEASALQSDTGFISTVKWEAQTTPAHPIEATTVQYLIAVPAAGLTAPNGANWSDANVSADTEGTDAAVFAIDSRLEEDQCLFVRVNTSWDGNVTYGVPKLVSKGVLADPSGVSVTTNQSSYKATINATNESDVPDSFIAVVYRTGKDDFVIGIIPHGQSSITVQCPKWDSTPAFGVYAAVGSYSQAQRADGVTSYNVTAEMKSQDTSWKGGTVPVAPANVYVEQTANTGTVRVSWSWSWEDATGAVLSWADHDDAWESTDEPETYEVSNLHAAQWNISNLAAGKTWYIRMKFVSDNGEAVIESPWSDMVSIDLSSAPAIPVLSLSKGVITADESLTAFWSFVSTDGTLQTYAEICEAFINGTEITYGKAIAHTETAQQVTIVPSKMGWKAGETHSLCLKVASASGKMSDSWSDPATVIVAPKIQAEITSSSLVNATITAGGVTRTALSLKAMPLTVTVSGAGAGGTSTTTIDRAEDYHMARPDETEFDGFEGESIAVATIQGNGTVTIGVDDLIGSLDDDARYILTLTVKDSYGQTSSVSKTFEVHWTQQAVIPNGTVEIDGLIAKLTPIATAGMASTDKCDIYRLSADLPELILKGADYGTVYVDPYPAIGGGYRFVDITANGDYITADNEPAWIDIDSGFKHDHAIIDFDGEQVQPYYNLDLSNNWEKDFQATRYLGGSIKGDWNAGVMRTTTLSTVTLTEFDAETINGLRLLAEYAGICHIRTLDGSSFKADLQVSEDRDHDDYGAKASFSISGTRVDPEELDGMTFEQWSEGNDELE